MCSCFKISPPPAHLSIPGVPSICIDQQLGCPDSNLFFVSSLLTGGQTWNLRFVDAIVPAFGGEGQFPAYSDLLIPQLFPKTVVSEFRKPRICFFPPDPCS